MKKLLKIFKTEGDDNIDKKKYWVYILLLIGIFIIFVGNTLFSGKKAPDDGNVIPADIEESLQVYVDYLERRLEGTLAQIEGVGNVSVMITLRSGKEIIVASDQKISEQATSDQGKTANNTQRDTKVTLLKDTPLVLRELQPIVEGVVVVADGADNAEVQNKIVGATVALLDVKAHKVGVYKKK